jgi:hypothetical protein
MANSHGADGMDDPTTYGAEIADLTVSRLKEIGLTIDEVSSKQERMERAKVCLSMEC